MQARIYSQSLDVSSAAIESRLGSGSFDRLQLKAGLRLSNSAIVVGLLLFLALLAIIQAFIGLMFVILLLVSAILFAVFYWNYRYQKRRRLIFESTPEVIDDVIRGIDAGRSLEQALVNALNDAPKVFFPLLFRLRSAVESGRDYTGLIDDFSKLYSIPPLTFVAVALRTSSHYGSAVRPVLKKVSRSLRSQQEMRREFLAATAETRFTAMAFAVLPLVIGASLIGLNESFRDVLLDTESGQKMLMTSIGLIVVGTIIVFRMVQGVGRG
ncbi:type II secretion protein F [Alcanivorax sp. 97CO-6]|nr:type II secretion protein F [Alcanivorax sp. 97CO-6]